MLAKSIVARQGDLKSDLGVFELKLHEVQFTVEAEAEENYTAKFSECNIEFVFLLFIDTNRHHNDFEMYKSYIAARLLQLHEVQFAVEAEAEENYNAKFSECNIEMFILLFIDKNRHHNNFERYKRYIAARLLQY